MAAVVGGLIRSILAGGGVAVPITMDETSKKAPTAFPYITISEGLDVTRYDSGAPSLNLRSELVQVDIWQKREGAQAEDSVLPLTVERLLNAAGPAQLTANGGFVYRLLVVGSRRLFDKEARIVHHALTVRATRRI